MDKDLIQKRCLGDNGRFADLLNGYVFKGKQVLQAKDLTDMDTQSGMWDDGHVRGRKRYRGRRRDLMKKASLGVNFAVVGAENQGEVHYLMPLRNMGYDVAEYERQAEIVKKAVRNQRGITKAEFLSGFRKESRLHPCITVVLYFGDDWDGSCDLHGIIDFTDIPEELKEYVNNYRIHLLEVKKMENTDVFQTDLKQIFDFIRCSGDKQKLRNLVESNPIYQEMEEDAYDMAIAYADAEELMDVKKYRGKDGKVNMCEGIREMIEDGRLEGIMEGRLEGREEGLIAGKKAGSEEATRNFVRNMLKRGMDEEDIKALAECDQAMIKEVKRFMHKWGRGGN